jgi:hypothetical protein
MADESIWIERFYTHFLGRDFTYLFAGGLFICIVQYVWYNDIFLPQHLSIELFGFLLASYFLGIVIRDFGVKIFPSLIDHIPTNYESPLIFFQDLVKKYDSRVINLYERDSNMLVITISIGSSSFFGGVLMGLVGFSRWFFRGIASENYIFLTLSLIAIGYFLLFSQAKEEIGNIEKERNYFATYIGNEKNNQ